MGGGIALNNPNLVLEPIKKNIEKYSMNRIPKIEITPLGEEIIPKGAIAIAMKPTHIPKEYRRFE